MKRINRQRELITNRTGFTPLGDLCFYHQSMLCYYLRWKCDPHLNIYEFHSQLLQQVSLFIFILFIGEWCGSTWTVSPKRFCYYKRPFGTRLQSHNFKVTIRNWLLIVFTTISSKHSHPLNLDINILFNGSVCSCMVDYSKFLYDQQHTWTIKKLLPVFFISRRNSMS